MQLVEAAGQRRTEPECSGHVFSGIFGLVISALLSLMFLATWGQPSSLKIVTLAYYHPIKLLNR